MKSSTAIPPISIEPDVPAPLSYHRPFLNCLVRLAHAPAPLLCIFTQPDNAVTTHSVGRLRSTTQRGLLPALADTSSHPLRPSACKCTIHLLGPNPRQKEYVFRNPTMLTSLSKRSVAGTEDDGRAEITHTAIGTSSFHAHFGRWSA